MSNTKYVDKSKAECLSQARTSTVAWVIASRRSLRMKGRSHTHFLRSAQTKARARESHHAVVKGLMLSSFSRLYRGISAPILMEAPKRATKFAANDEWGKFYRNLFGMAKMNQSLSILTGASAGATEAFVVVPFELVKIRLQGQLYPPG